jgi:hypothetical protein
MPLISAVQLLDKTIYIAKPTEFYRVSDIISKGDKATPISNKLKEGYFFVLDSFLTPVQENNNYGFKTATRSDYYWLFKGRDGGSYAVKYKNDGRFSLKKLIEQGVKTVKQQVKEKTEEEKTPIDKAVETAKDLFTGATSTVKNILYIGLGVIAVGYLIPKFTK